MQYYVVVNRKGILGEIELFTNLFVQEEAFRTQCTNRGVEPIEANYTEGFIEFKDGTTICLGSIDSAKAHTPLELARNAIWDIFNAQANFSRDRISILLGELERKFGKVPAIRIHEELQGKGY
jgi:hypothetical protein